MGIARKVITVGNSVAVLLPKEVLARLKVEAGDTVYFTETSEGVQISPYDERFANQVEAAEDFMKKYRDVLRELAK